jgi:glutaminase
MSDNGNKADNGGTDLDALLGKVRGAASPLRAVLREIHTKYKDFNEGAVANYIPELARANPKWFGIAIVTVDGTTIEIGDSKELFTIQSLSKPFVWGLALEDNGRDHVETKIGVEPTGDAFNSIVLDEATNRPFNPMVNAGAIAAADLVKGKDISERVNRMIEMFRRYMGRTPVIDTAVYTSERTTGHRNRAIAHMMLNFGMVTERVPDSLDFYFQQCSVLIHCADLALMGATLANDGVNPVTGERALDAKYVRDLLSVMYTCGMYDFSGEWSYRVGLPAKSGVGGGIVAVVPGRMGIATFSPLLDARGNSARGIKACQELADRFGLHVFESAAQRKEVMV